MALPYKQYIDRRLEGKRKIHNVPAALDFNGLLVEALRPLWVAAGRLESGYLPDAARTRRIEKPVYVCGMARAGTTLLLEAIYRTGAFAAHNYRAYPYIDIPVIWERWTRLPPGTNLNQPMERGHLDLLDITPDSPEAMEEMIWTHFFPRAHDPAVSNVLDETARRPSFDSYYTDHIRKVMHIASRNRYLAKGNYNMTRMAYILSLFPDAKFVIPVRRAEAQIASLMKQHYLFTRLEENDPRARRYMRRAGHFEFGLNRTPINCGDDAAVAEIQKAWRDGEEVRGWALYWAMIHNFIRDQVLGDKKIAPNVRVLRYEDLCAQPENVLQAVMDYCGAGPTKFAQEIRIPDYYDPGFTAAERKTIADITRETEIHFFP
jgi:hypothetical protein